MGTAVTLPLPDLAYLVRDPYGLGEHEVLYVVRPGAGEGDAGGGGGGLGDVLFGAWSAEGGLVSAVFGTWSGVAGERDVVVQEWSE